MTKHLICVLLVYTCSKEAKIYDLYYYENIRNSGLAQWFMADS